MAFTDYLRRVIGGNNRLNDYQKNVIMEKYTTWNDYEWEADETMEKFQRLICVMLGILHENEVDDVEDEEVAELWEALSVSGGHQAELKFAKDDFADY